MSRENALLLGALLAAGLFLLSFLGWRVQKERERVWALTAEQRELKARVAELRAELSAAQNPKDLLKEALSDGFVPLAEGRWAR